MRAGVKRGLTRRSCLAALATAPFAARAALPPRLVALDWGWAATAIAIGANVVGVAEQRLYRDWVGSPALPAGVAEVGRRVDPSLETLASLKPDLILTNSLNAALDARLQMIAPTFANPTWAENRAPLDNAREAARLLGERLSRPNEVSALLADLDSRVASARGRLATLSGRAFLPLSIIDRRHVTVYGDGSLFVDVLRALGLRGLWPGATSLWGSKTVAVSDLAGLPPGDLLVMDPLPPSAAAALAPSGLLSRLCVAETRALRRLPAAWGFGDVTAAARFADLLGEGLPT